MKGEINESKFRYLPKSALGVSFCQTSPFKASDEESLSIDLGRFHGKLKFYNLCISNLVYFGL